MKDTTMTRLQNTIETIKKHARSEIRGISVATNYLLIEMNPHMYPRKCDCCGKAFYDGYLDTGDYWCSEECLLKGNQQRDPTYTIKKWEEECDDGNSDGCYYTEWVLEWGMEAYDKDGNLYCAPIVDGTYIKESDWDDNIHKVYIPD